MPCGFRFRACGTRRHKLSRHKRRRPLTAERSHQKHRRELPQVSRSKDRATYPLDRHTASSAAAADRVLIREKFFRHFFVNDRHTARVFVFAFLLSEIAATEQFYPECLAVAGCDRGEE